VIAHRTLPLGAGSSTTFHLDPVHRMVSPMLLPSKAYPELHGTPAA
jgi:hypothetical protein